METFSALLAICAGNSPVTGESPPQRPVTRSFDVLFDLHLNKRLSKQSKGWWFETPSCPLWRHPNVERQHHCKPRIVTFVVTGDSVWCLYDTGSINKVVILTTIFSDSSGLTFLYQVPPRSHLRGFASAIPFHCYPLMAYAIDVVYT